MASSTEQETPPPNPHVATGGRQIHPPPLFLMDPEPPLSSSTRRRKQPPAPPGCSPGLLVDPVPPAPTSTAGRLPNYRRIAPIPPIRRSPPFAKHLTYWHRLGGDRDGITSLALTSLGGDGDCNRLSSWPHTPSSLAAIDEIQQLRSSGDESPPPLTASFSASDEIQPPPTTSSSSVDLHSAARTTQELGLANVVMCYKSLVLFVVAAVFIYIEHHYPAVLVSLIAGVLCIYMVFWSMHITRFWLNCPPYEDPSPILFLGCFTVFMVATLIGTQHSVLAGMCITLLTTMCMAGYLISCIHRYNCTRRRQNLEQPIDSGLHQDEHTLNS